MRIRWTRSALVAGLLAIASPAVAAPNSPVPPDQISHLLYLNNCLPDGCTVYPGDDDARSNHSTVASHVGTLSPYAWGQAKWDSLVQRVRELYQPFDLEIVDQDPGDVPHYEVMVGGEPAELGITIPAGGIAPFVPCDGEAYDNIITFVFAGQTSDENYLAGAIGQETAHAFGLDHALDASDAMTYLDLGSPKIFHDHDAQCGEDTPRECTCRSHGNGSSLQNSYRFLLGHLGPSTPTAPTVAIQRPRDGAWVKPGFAIVGSVQSTRSITAASLLVDGAALDATPGANITASAPLDLAAGDHQLMLAGTNSWGLSSSATTTVHVVSSCTAATDCDGGFVCLGGYCLPDADIEGGLGATCAVDANCTSGTCASDGEAKLCTAACDADQTCPDGYDCGSDNRCWPSASSGGCNTSGDRGSAPWLLFGAFGLVVVARRRRR